MNGKRYVGCCFSIPVLWFFLMAISPITHAQEPELQSKPELKVYEEAGISEFYKADFDTALRFLKKVLEAKRPRLSKDTEKEWERLVNFSIESYIRTNQCRKALNLSQEEYRRMAIAYRELEEYLELTIEELKSMLDPEMNGLASEPEPMNEVPFEFEGQSLEERPLP